jgi:hypothetical protein
MKGSSEISNFTRRKERVILGRKLRTKTDNDTLFLKQIHRSYPNDAQVTCSSVSDHVGFVVHKLALGQVFSEYFGFPCQSSFHHLLHNHHHLYHLGLVRS